MENTITIDKAATLLGVTVKTLQRWEREGKLYPIGRTLPIVVYILNHNCVFLLGYDNPMVKYQAGWLPIVVFQVQLKNPIL